MKRFSVNEVCYSPVKWTLRADTYQIVKRKTLQLVDRDEVIHEELHDLSTAMQTRANALLAKKQDVYVMLILFEEKNLRTGYVLSR